MAIRHLAEAVILQSAEDFWSPSFRPQSIDFFMGNGFKIYADLAGMKVVERLRLLRLLRGSAAGLMPTRHHLWVRRMMCTS